jgi:hypothetical protein
METCVNGMAGSKEGRVIFLKKKLFSLCWPVLLNGGRNIGKYFMPVSAMVKYNFHNTAIVQFKSSK